MKAINFSNKYIKSSLFTIAGLLLGWLLFHHSTPVVHETKTALHEQADTEKAIWTCAMHPQIRMDKPGNCPICGMELIPLQKANTELNDQAIEMSESAMKLAEVQTSKASKEMASKEVLLYGKIQPDEKLLQSQTSHVPGRIEQLFINVTGETVKNGQLIAKIYSPELINAQKELLESVSMADKYPEVLEAAREKLRNWKLSEQQIKAIETSGKITSTFDLFSNTSGIVTNLKIIEGDYVNKGTVLFDVADLSKVWAVFDAYESDLPWISMNQKVEFTTQAIPGKIFEGKISFIDPVIDPATRVARVRAEIPNTGKQFKPELFINGKIESTLKNGGKQLIIPQSAVLWTGTRSVVYVKVPGMEHPTFEMRQITLGPSLQDSYIILDGLNQGEEIITNGAFSVDAAAQLAGKPSMMNTEGGKTLTMPGMLMPGDAKSDITQSMPGMDMNKQTKTNADETLKQVVINISGNCDMCKDRIETAAKSVKGVKTANWSPENHQLQLRFNNQLTSSDAVQKAIAAVGHDTEKYRAPDSVYNALPSCCLYRK